MRFDRLLIYFYFIYIYIAVPLTILVFVSATTNCYLMKFCSLLYFFRAAKVLFFILKTNFFEIFFSEFVDKQNTANKRQRKLLTLFLIIFVIFVSAKTKVIQTSVCKLVAFEY